MRRMQLLIAVFVAASIQLHAQTVWKADKAHSSVRFSVIHLVISEVTGRFTDFDATLDQKTNDDFSGSTVSATIKTASVNTDNDYRDKHLRSDDFFNADSFPTITFKSVSFEKTGENTYAITGPLTIRDSTKNVVLNAKFNGQVTDKRGNVHIGFKAMTTIDRFAFGTKWNAAMESGSLVVSRDVDITLTLEFLKEQKPAEIPK